MRLKEILKSELRLPNEFLPALVFFAVCAEINN